MTDVSETGPPAKVRLGTVLALSLCTPFAWAQADSQQAFEEARRLFTSEDFERARDLLIEASYTDTRNPEVFLWLGRAHYQLGELDEAMAAWQTTLRLAPDEPHATRMLAVLRGVSTEVEPQLRLVEMMLRERLFQAAARECTALLEKSALTREQRSHVMRLQGEVWLGQDKPREALAVLRRLQVEDEAAGRTPETMVLVGLARLRSAQVVEGLASLRAVNADHAGTAAATTAELEILRFELGEAPSADGATALAEWIAAHGDHPRVTRARRALIDAWLAIAGRGAIPAQGAVLDDAVKSALTVAQQLYEASDQEQNWKLTQRLLQFFARHYGSRGAWSAAAEAATQLLARPLSPAARRLCLGALANYQVELALRALTARVGAGEFSAGDGPEPLPGELQAALGTFATIAAEFPAEPASDERAQLAERVRGLAAGIPWPESVIRPRAPSVWAVDIALPLVSVTAGSASDSAAQTILRVVADLAPKSHDVALSVHARLLEVLPTTHGRWQQAVLQQTTLLDGAARAAFARNVLAGRGADNAILGDLQRQLIAAQGRLVERSAVAADGVRQALAAHLQPWIEHGHFTVAEQAWTLLEPALPAVARRQVRLMVATLWVDEVLGEHARLQAVGLTVPRELSPRLAQALQRLYVLQERSAEQPQFAAAVRETWDRIVAHYRALDYFDVAEQALAVRGDRVVPDADQYAELQLARLNSELAARELARLVKRHDGQRQITATPAFREALDGYLKFLTDHPSSGLAPQAVDGILQIAALFERHRAYPAAARVLAELAAAAGRVPLVAQVDPGGSSAAARARLARARALDAEARRALGEQLAHRERGVPPPATLSDEFAAAVAAYREFLTAHPGSVLVGEALAGVMAVGVEYARVGAWSVAEGVYTDLLASGLALGNPERIEFCRGLCKLAPSMPEHALEVLTAVVSGRPTSGLVATATAKSRHSRELDELRDLDAERRAVVMPPSTGNRADDGEVVLQTIRNHEVARAALVAQLRDPDLRMGRGSLEGQRGRPPGQGALSAAEVARLRASIDAAYEVFLGILRSHPQSATADQARAEILVMVGHWRSLSRWAEAAGLAERFLSNQPDDAGLPQLRLEVARDYLSLAADPIEERASLQAMLGTVAERFDKARAALARIVVDFPRRRELVRQAQWDIARSWLTQARVVAAFSSTLARGQFVRASRELQQVAAEYHDHPNIGQVPEMQWRIAQELVSKGFFTEAILVFSELMVRHPAHARADQAQWRIAQIYQQHLRQPLRAAEAYQELNFARGGNDVELQNAIFQIGLQLQSERRWVEALHVLETFVDSFPTHPRAGQALSLLGNIHQANMAWDDAIAAYDRVISDYGDGEFVKAVRWSTAECVINLSRWGEAIAAYREFISLYPEDHQSSEAESRIEILKDLERYQRVVDEEGQRKAFDAQYQIATIVRERLANPVKAIIEFRLVKERWPECHLADDAMYQVGATHLTLGDTAQARAALLAVADDYPTSPLADDALYLVGRSYEDEAALSVSVTREESLEQAKEVAQRAAYSRVQAERRRQLDGRAGKIADLKRAGQDEAAGNEEASAAAFNGSFASANAVLFAQWADQQTAALTATQLAHRQDKFDAALRKAVEAYATAARVAAGDKAGDALLRMAKIHDELLKDADAAMKTWLEIVRQFSGTAVAEDASWRIAQYHERAKKHAEAIEAFEAFLRNYRRSPRAGEAQIAIAENHEQLGQWVNAMDAYTNYINSFQQGPFLEKAREQIRWIKTYRL